MKCPIEARENAEFLLAYCTRKLDAERTATARTTHGNLPGLPRVSRTASERSGKRWTHGSGPRDAGFRRRLYRRIDREVSWWQLLMRPVRPGFGSPGVAHRAAACVLVMAGVLLERPASAPPVAQPQSAQMEAIQPDQVDHALDAMYMLGVQQPHATRRRRFQDVTHEPRFPNRSNSVAGDGVQPDGAKGAKTEAGQAPRHARRPRVRMRRPRAP